jgi:hypothetical protein
MPSAATIQLTAAQQEELERCVASRTLPVRAAERAKIILGLAAGKAKQQIAKQLGIARQTVRRWELRYLQQGTEKGLRDAPRSGRPRLIAPEKIQQIVHKATQEAPLNPTQVKATVIATEHPPATDALRSCQAIGPLSFSIELSLVQREILELIVQDQMGYLLDAGSPNM